MTIKTIITVSASLLALATVAPTAASAQETPDARLVIETELAELGPSPAERLAAIAPTPAENTAMKKIVESWNARPRKGYQEGIRADRLDELVDRFGLKAIPVLVEALGSDSYWFRRTASQGCADVVKRFGEDARWLLYRFDTPAAQITLFGSGPEAERTGVHVEVHDALRVVTTTQPDDGTDVDADSLYTLEEIAASDARVQAAWTDLWTELREDWVRKEAIREARRDELKKRLRELEENDVPLAEQGPTR